MLEVAGLQAWYGSSQALFGVDLSVGAGEAVALMGRNGMGKTTTVRAVMGQARGAGRVWFDGFDLSGRRPNWIARRGIGLVPEGRHVFPTLTVRENLVATARATGAEPWTEDRICALFPRLGERRGQFAGSLSGGEQQMLAIGRALMTNPRLLILDEATEGLAPLVRAEIWRCLRRLRDEGQAILIIDKHLDAIARLVDRVVVLVKGRVAWTGAPAALAADPDLATELLGL